MEEEKKAQSVQIECPFCGQHNMTVIGGELSDFTDEELRDLGAKACNCNETFAYKRAYYARVDADAAVEKLFAEESELFRNFLHEAVKVVSSNTVKKMTAVNENGIKAIISPKDSNIRVERAETIKRIIEGHKEKGVDEEL